jgi:hypothetical protein
MAPELAVAAVSGGEALVAFQKFSRSSALISVRVNSPQGCVLGESERRY